MKTRQANSLKGQLGVSKLGLAVLMLMITSFFTLGVKVGPMYVDHNLITSICQELIDNGEAEVMTITDVRNRVATTMRINNIYGFELSNIRMRKDSGGPVIRVNYERRVSLIGNLDVVAKFDSTLQ